MSAGQELWRQVKTQLTEMVTTAWSSLSVDKKADGKGLARSISESIVHHRRRRRELQSAFVASMLAATGVRLEQAEILELADEIALKFMLAELADDKQEMAEEAEEAAAAATSAAVESAVIDVNRASANDNRKRIITP